MSDTIAAISTPCGVGGIAVVRISGPEAKQIAEGFTKPLADHRATYAVFREGEADIDEVVATYFQAPKSFTGEDVVEIACHGSRYAQEKILQSIITQGARMAEAGEFTRRAFVNGRLNLSQAEAVADLIDSTNAASHQLAISQLRGGYARQLQELRESFVKLTSLMELELDFSDEEVEFADRKELKELVAKIERECQTLAQSFQMGNAIKNGVPVAIVGRPNVGKSTLLNALVGEERAIVSDIAGTTRDTVEDTMVVDGILIRFIDTAGLRKSNDGIEQAGIERSYKAVEKAAVVMYVAEASHPREEYEQELKELGEHVNLEGKKIIVLLNKSDQKKAEPKSGEIAISAKYGEGIEEVKQALKQAFDLKTSNYDTVLTNARHYEALKRIIDAIGHIKEGLEQGLPGDLVVVDIRDALYHLGTITGEVSSEEILGSIFSRFCIGK